MLDPLLSRRYRAFAIATFYLFLMVAIACKVLADERLTLAGDAAGFGLGAAALLWWIVDASLRRVTIPYMSLWICFQWWPIVVPGYYLSTRGWRGAKKLVLHGVLAAAVMFVAALFGTSAVSGYVSSQPTAEDRELAQRFGCGPDAVVTARQLGSNLRAFVPAREGWRPDPALTGFMFDPYSSGPAAVADLRSVVGEHHVAFVAQRSNPFTGEGATVAVVRAKDAFEVVRALGTNGDNHRVPNAAVMARLRAWDAEYGIAIHGVGFDWVSFDLETLPADVPAFAKEVYEFCPDAVDQSLLESVEALARSIAEDRTVTLWWD